MRFGVVGGALRCFVVSDWAPRRLCLAGAQKPWWSTGYAHPCAEQPERVHRAEPQGGRGRIGAHPAQGARSDARWLRQMLQREVRESERVGEPRVEAAQRMAGAMTLDVAVTRRLLVDPVVDDPDSPANSLCGSGGGHGLSFLPRWCARDPLRVRGIGRIVVQWAGFNPRRGDPSLPIGLPDPSGLHDDALLSLLGLCLPRARQRRGHRLRYVCHPTRWAAGTLALRSLRADLRRGDGHRSRAATCSDCAVRTRARAPRRGSVAVRDRSSPRPSTEHDRPLDRTGRLPRALVQLCADAPARGG